MKWYQGILAVAVVSLFVLSGISSMGQLQTNRDGNSAGSAASFAPMPNLPAANATEPYQYSVQHGNMTNGAPGSTGAFTGSSISLEINSSLKVVEYAVEFNETGLEPGDTWGIEFSNGTSVVSTSKQISEEMPDGSYSFRVFSINKSWAPVHRKVAMTVSGCSVTVSVQFSLYTYRVVFRETGLETGTNWRIDAGSHSYLVNGTSITLISPNGTLHYSVKPISGYDTANQSGNVSISGHDVAITISFTRPSGFSPLIIFSLVVILGTIVAITFAWTKFNGKK